ncbi:uncharacterized protein Dwil_GK12061 [Drosophila willistoni]|uniref:NADP-dependent oxidoreductase domain-containing protein n=1 Tax=Drosophila willistoni TaxID=7260 RepID=B4N8I0_DROWI|nr:1,5-anhydro-D-fructose reductase [Drosophila willistoni]EDW81431.1 uncharacterized protein Dwil_GK12061 [Drosophila willistoni]
MSCNELLSLHNGLQIPVLGLGTWQASDVEIETALEIALEMGYRHIDTALRYGNEGAIGKVLKRWLDAGKIKREELFISTKLPLNLNRPHEVETTFQKSLANLQLDYIDLYLIHTPFTVFTNEDGSVKFDKEGLVEVDSTTDHVATWAEMEKLVEKGWTKSIGVSNFSKEQIQRLLKNCKIRPANLQIEHHVYLQQRDLIDFCKAEDITVTACSPLGSKGNYVKLNAKNGIQRRVPDLLEIPEVKEIAVAHNKTSAQVLLRWIIETGVSTIPKSTNPEHLRENMNIFDFDLTAEEMDKLLSLDRNFRICDLAMFRGIERHPEFTFKNQYTK